MDSGKGLLLSVSSAVIAELSPLASAHIPPIILEIFQCLAWLGAFSIGVVTVIKYIKNQKTKTQ